MKNKIFTVILATFVGLYLPACAGGGDDGMLLFPLGGPTEGGPEESPQDITDGLEIVVAEEAEAVVDDGEADTTDPEETGTESAEAADAREEAAEDAAEGETADSDEAEEETTGEVADGSETSGDTIDPDAEGTETDESDADESTADADDSDSDVAGDTSGNNGNNGNAGNNGNNGNNNNAGNNGNNGNNAACSTRSIELDPTQGRWFKDDKRGFYTMWARQKLILRVRGNCEAGWYKLKVKAKNIRGPLPDFYSRFNLTVSDNVTGRQLGGMFIKASDVKVRKGRMWVYLNSGDSDLNLGWTNDAWKRGVYDANIHITKVALSKKPKVRKRKAFRRNAQNYCYERGRWFFDEKARTARTYWRNQTIGYCFYGLQPGTYEIQVRARNYGKAGLPPGYENFQVTVAADGVTGDAIIPAHETKFRKGKAVLDLRGGNVTVNLTWLNDRYKKGQYDANIEIRSVRLKRIGDSSRTGLSAFLSNAGQGTGLVITVSVVVALLGLGLLYAYRRKTGEQDA